MLEPKSTANCDHRADVNCAPLSEVTSAGAPNLEIHPWRKALAKPNAVVSLTGNASGQRVKQSTTVRRWVYPWEGCRGPTTST